MTRVDAWKVARTRLRTALRSSDPEFRTTLSLRMAGAPAALARARDELATLRAALPAYEIADVIRAGGQGVIYRATQKATGRSVALKFLPSSLSDPRPEERFLRETRLAARLDHPHIVPIYESGVAAGRLYYAMKYVDGVSLTDWALLHDPTWREVVRTFVQACRAVAYAHQNGIIHRDLHAGNLMVDDAGTPYLLDFGLAKETDAELDPRVSSEDQVIGALPFLSPEQLGGGDGRVDTRSDVYSLGVLLYLVLAEQFPYPVEGPASLVRASILSCPPRPLRAALAEADPRRRIRARDASADLEAILQRALAKEKSRRYGSADALADDLEHLLAGHAVQARAAQRMYMLRKTVQRYRWPVAAVAVLLLTLGVATAWTQHALANARAATRVACGQFNLAMNTLEESLRVLPGSRALREQLLEQVGRELPVLAQRLAGDPELAELTLDLKERQADIALARGDVESALAAYREILETTGVTANGVQTGAPVDCATLTRVLRCCRAGGLSLFESGMFELGVAIADEYAALLASCDESRRAELRLRASFADQAGIRGQTDRTQEQCQSVITAYEQAGMPLDEEWQRSAALCYALRARDEQQKGAVEAAIRDYSTSVAMRRRLVLAQPWNAEFRRALAGSCEAFSELHRSTSRDAEAITWLREAETHRQLLYQSDPERVDDLARLQRNASYLARACASLGDDTLAMQYADRALSLGHELASRVDIRHDYATRLPTAYALCAELAVRQKQYLDAVPLWQRAIADLTYALEHQPDDKSARDTLANYYRAFSETLSRAGEYDEARCCALESERRYRELLAAGENSDYYRLRFVRALLEVAVSHLGPSGDRSTAAAALGEARHLLTLSTYSAHTVEYGFCTRRVTELEEECAAAAPVAVDD